MRCESLLILILLVSSCRLNADDSEKSIQNVLSSIIDADNRSDIKTVLSFYASDAILMPANKSSIKGIEAIEQNYKTIFENSVLQLQTHAEEIRVSDTWAVVTGYNTGTVTNKKDSSRAVVNDKFMMIMEKQKNGWKIKRLIWNKNQGQ